MYNEEIKERFLHECSTSGINEQRKKFDAIGIYESEIKKDFAEMSYDEAIEAMRNVKIGSYSTATSTVAFVCRYLRWCCDNAVFENVNKNLLDIKADDIDASRYLSKMWFKDEQDLIDKMRMVRPFDDGYYEIVVMLFAWLGIEQKLLLKIKPSDVDFENSLILISESGNHISFSEEIGKVIYEYAKTLMGSRQHNGEPTTVYKDDLYGKFLCKFCRKAELGDNELTDLQISYAVNGLNQAYMSLGNEGCFKYSNVLACGAARRIWELSEAGIDVSLMKNKGLVKDAARVNANRCNLLWLYKNYKRVFNL